MRAVRGVHGQRLRRVQVLPRQAQVWRGGASQAGVCGAHVPHAALASGRRWRAVVAGRGRARVGGVGRDARLKDTMGA
eukprot:2013263-Prymnesium_polylepis.1